MYLINTTTLKLRSFSSPDAVHSGYAILSHVWEESGEQSFQDVQMVHQQCAVSGEDPHDLVSEKIRRCCELSRRHGYEWVWIDTCCIDKTSSAELSEAINSMYRYYSLARVCYAYLNDVPSRRDRSWLLQFQRSRWHCRGWTLQELLAPNVVLFLANTWDVLAAKTDLAAELEEITSIPASVLRLQEHHGEMSVAQRMSWAAWRETTRVEDKAYCLLGMFDINMPTLYGEGEKAFRRLQEEILKTSIDTTLFAWDMVGRLAVPSDGMNTGLFAPSPRYFGLSQRIRYINGAHATSYANHGPGEVRFFSLRGLVPRHYY